MSDRGGGLTRDIILRVKAENLSTATFTQAAAAVNQLTAALDKQMQAAARGDIKEKELTETLTKLQNAAKTFAETTSQIKVFEGFEPRIKAAEAALANAGTKLEEFRQKNGTSELATRKLQSELERLERTFGTMGTRLATLRDQQTEYGTKLAQSGIDVNNLAQSEQHLKTATDQAAASIQHLTDFKANYAKITREVAAALKAQQAAEEQVAAAERARVAAHQQATQQLVAERRGSYNVELQEQIKSFNDQRAAERAAIEEQQQAQRQAQQQLITERRGSYHAEMQDQIQVYNEKRAAERKVIEDEKARIKERRDVQIRANQINQDLALQQIQAQLKTREKAGSERAQQEAAEAHRLEQERVRAVEVQRRSDLGVMGRYREDYRERKRIRDEERAATRTAAREEAGTRGRTTSGRPGQQVGIFGLPAYQATNLGYQATDVVQGFLSGVSPGIIAAQQGPQIVQIFGLAILKWVPVITAGLAAVAVAVGALNRVMREESAIRQFDATLKSNATAIGYSSQTLAKYTKDIRDMGVAWADAVKFVQLAIAGNVSQGRITQVGQLAQDLADINKTNFLDNAKQLIEGLDGTKAGIDKLQIALHLWTPEQYKFIQDQIAAGKAVDAMRFALDHAADRQRDAAKNALDPAARSARSLSTAWDEMLTSIGKTTAFGVAHTAMVMFIDDVGKAANEIDRIVKSQNPWASFWDSFLKPIMDPIKKVLELTKPGPGSQPATTPSATAAEQSVGVRKTNEDIAREWLRTHNYPAAQTAGIMGNLGVESGFNPASVGPGGHFGIAQWDKTRQAALGGSTDIVRQLELLDKELTALDSGFKTRTGTAKEFALQFDKVFERSGDSAEAEKARVERVRQAEQYYRPGDKPTAAPAAEPVKNAVPEEQKIEIEKTLVPLREQEKIRRSISIQAERAAELDRITREVNERGGTDDQKREQIRLQMREVDAKLNREQAEQTAKDERQKIDDARHYNEIKAAGDKAAAEAQKNSLNGWRDVQRERDAGEAKERDRLARLDSQNDKLKEAIKLVTDLEKASDKTYKTDLEKRHAAIAQEFKDTADQIKKKRDESPLLDPAKFNEQLEKLPALEERRKGQETGDVLMEQLKTAAATRKDLIDSYKHLRELGVISITEEEEKIKGAFDLTAKATNDSIAALEKWLETAKELGVPAEKIEKIRASMAELKAEAVQVDPFIKGLTKTIEESFTNRAAEAFDTAAEAIGGLIAKTKSWKDVWTSLRSAAANFFAGILKDIAAYIIKAQLAKLASSFMSSFGGATSAASTAASGAASAVGAVGSAGAGSGGFLSMFLGSSGASVAAVVHSGGVVGVTQLPQRAVPGSWFDRAPRYHNGGVAGLAANEQAAILQRGEEVLTADNPRNMRNMTSAAPRDINIRNVLVADPELVPSHMGSARGEKVIMNVLKSNAATVRQLVR